MTNATETYPGYATGTWKLDPTHSELSFSIRHLAISKVRGTFDAFDVTVTNSDDLAATKIEATVDVASVNTNNKDRDGHLLASDFFLVEEHPTFSFTSTSVEVDGEDLTITGDLTLRGITKPITLKGEFGGIATDGYGQTKAGATATTKIDRTEFGVSFNSALETGGVALGNDVTISIDLQLVLQK